MKAKGQRGQALIIIAFALIGLIGMTGLAVDGGMAYSDRRHAQNAADNAAVAGALAKINAVKANKDPRASVTIAALNMTGQYGYSGLAQDADSNTVKVYTCNEDDSSCGPAYDGKSDYVQVIITSHINTFFAGVIGIPQMHNRVQAIAFARAAGNLYDGNNIIALNPTCNNNGNTFSVEGSPVIDLSNSDGTQGSLYINTGEASCGFTCNTSAGDITGNIITAGSDPLDGLSNHCTEEIGEENISTDGKLFDFPVTLADMGIKVPPECTTPLGTYTNHAAGTYSFDGGDPTKGVSVLTPGRYSDFPPQKEISEGKLYNQIFMMPGVYCVNHVIQLTENNLTLIGHNVTFFLRAGYDFQFMGGTVDIDAPDNGDYAGYLMILEPDYGNPPLSEDSLNCRINGNIGNTFEGAIFAPYCDITIDGGSGSIGIDSQIIGYTVKINGGGTINFSYDSSKNPHINAQTGLMK